MHKKNGMQCRKVHFADLPTNCDRTIKLTDIKYTQLVYNKGFCIIFFFYLFAIFILFNNKNPHDHKLRMKRFG